jgi:activating signal cointegrator complex subunit 3
MDESHIDSVFEAVHKFPNLAVEISITVGENASPVEVPKRNSKWFEAEADTECTLLINLKRLNKLGHDEKAFAPKFPKPQPENWFLALGDIENQQDILAMKRVKAIRGSSTQQLNFWTPEDSGRVILTLYIMSDSYIGLDQQYDINLEVVKHKK